MKFIKCVIFTLIIAICEARIIKQSTSYSSRSSIAGNSLEEGSSGRVNPSGYNSGKTRAVRPQRPNVAPIRPGYAARSSDSGRSHAPEATSWRDPQSSQPQRELIFVSRRNMKKRLGPAGSNSRRHHSRRKHHHRNNSERTQPSRVQRPTELPIRPAFTIERPAKFRHRNPEAFTRRDFQSSRSQQKQKFVPQSHNLRPNLDSARTNLRGNCCNRMRSQETKFARIQPSRVQRPNELPIRPAFTTEKPPAKFRHRNPEAFARSDLQSSSSQREQIFVSPPRHIRPNLDTAKTNLRGNYYNKMRTQETNLARTQASRLQKPYEIPIRPAFTIRKPAKFRHRNPEAFARSKPQFSSAVI